MKTITDLISNLEILRDDYKAKYQAALNKRQEALKEAMDGYKGQRLQLPLMIG